jgi:hypothetical protein
VFCNFIYCVMWSSLCKGNGDYFQKHISKNLISLYHYHIKLIPCYKRSRDSSVGIATRYVLEGPGIESQCGEIFRTYPDRLRGPPSLLYNEYRLFPRVKGGRGVMLTTHPLLVPRLRKSWAIPPLTLWVLLGLLGGSLYSLPLLQKYIYCTKQSSLYIYI